jgi:S-adenosylmethionine hydrolase
VTTYDWISLLTDFGTYDGYVAQCRGSIARVAPRVRCIDITHEIPPQDIRRGAVVLSQIVGQLPPAVHVAVVDPGVGTERRGIALETAAGVLVGPDNGLLPWAADKLGGTKQAVALTNTEYHLGLSATFHGRDIFSPVAAHVANGVAIAELGDPVDPVTLIRLPDPVLRIDLGVISCELLTTDRYGNLQTSASAAAVAEAGFGPGDRLEWTIGGAELSVPLGRTYGEVAPGEFVGYLDSASMLGLGLNGGSAEARLGVNAGDPISIRRSGSLT